MLAPRGETTARAGWVLGIVGTLLNTLSCLGVFAYIAVVATMVTAMATNPAFKGPPAKMKAVPMAPKVPPPPPVEPKPAPPAANDL